MARGCLGQQSVLERRSTERHLPGRQWVRGPWARIMDGVDELSVSGNVNEEVPGVLADSPMTAVARRLDRDAREFKRADPCDG